MVLGQATQTFPPVSARVVARVAALQPASRVLVLEPLPVAVINADNPVWVATAYDVQTTTVRVNDYALGYVSTGEIS